jgi:hypothetical protein
MEETFAILRKQKEGRQREKRAEFRRNQSARHTNDQPMRGGRRNPTYKSPSFTTSEWLADSLRQPREMVGHASSLLEARRNENIERLRKFVDRPRLGLHDRVRSMARSQSCNIRNYSSVQLGDSSSLQKSYRDSVERYNSVSSRPGTERSDSVSSRQPPIKVMQEKRESGVKMQYFSLRNDDSQLSARPLSIEYGYLKDERDKFFERREREDKELEWEEAMGDTEEFAEEPSMFDSNRVDETTDLGFEGSAFKAPESSFSSV